ncbi:stage II sporulation protein M [Halovenus marina]|uniref:stage II sporulation protein M n=1 Tax=Halovenus marina TaxID=3396621 RepID=UPI003F55396F
MSRLWSTLVTGVSGLYSRVAGLLRGWGVYIVCAAGLFLGTALLGVAIGVERGSVPLVPFEVRTPGDPVPSLSAIDLFAHNGRIAVLLVGSALLFGLPAVVIQLFNGLLFGSIVAVGSANRGMGETLLLLLPHGIVELPAFWLAGAVGLRLTHSFWKVATGDRDRSPVPVVVLQSLALSLVVFGLLAVAALIEAHVTAGLV